MNRLILLKSNFPGAMSQNIGNGRHFIKNRSEIEIKDIPVWIPIPDVNVSQGLPWTIDLQDYVSGEPPITFVINTGSLPIGITLNANGTFSGTVTDIAGAGSVTFTATNPNGSSNSGTLSWTIP